MRCLIVGGGIMGLCTAWALRRDGHEVVLFEQGPIPNPLGSSVDCHRLIRYPYGAMEGYAALIDDAYQAWDALWLDLGETHYVETGCLGLSCTPDDWTEQSCRTMDKLGHTYVRLTPDEIETKYPHLSMEGIAWGFETPTGGALLADRIVAGLADWLESNNAHVHQHAEVHTIDMDLGEVRLGNGESFVGDAVLVTAGPWVQRLVPDIDRRATPSRQVVIYVAAPTDLHVRWSQTPVIIDLGADTGFYTVPPIAGYDMKIGDHTFSLTGDPDLDRTATAEEAQRIFDSACGRFRGMDGCRISDAKTCFYTVTRDERFHVEQIGRTWIATGFSGHGFKFGTLMGQALAQGINGTRTTAALEAWAAGRATA